MLALSIGTVVAGVVSALLRQARWCEGMRRTNVSSTLRSHAFLRHQPPQLQFQARHNRIRRETGLVPCLGALPAQPDALQELGVPRLAQYQRANHMLGETHDHPRGDRGTIDHQAMGDWCSVSCNLFLRFVTDTLSSGARVQSFTVDSRTCPKVSGFQLRTSAKNRRLLRVSEILNSSAQRRNQTMRFLASAPSSDVWSGPPVHRSLRIRYGAKSDWCHSLILHSCAVRGRWAR